MRHGDKINNLGRKTAHRNAMLRNMACDLFKHKRIKTTVAKAKALRKFVEPLVTKGRNNTTHSRRTVFSYLNNKYAVQELFDVVAPKVGDRPGGYTRIVKLSDLRAGDNAEMAIIELVDFNETYSTGRTKKAGSKKRSRRGGTGKSTKTTDAVKESVVEKVETKIEEATEDVKDKMEDVKEAVAEKVEEVKEEIAEKIEEAKEAVAEKVEEIKEEIADKADDVADAADEATESEEKA